MAYRVKAKQKQARRVVRPEGRSFGSSFMPMAFAAKLRFAFMGKFPPFASFFRVMRIVRIAHGFGRCFLGWFAHMVAVACLKGDSKGFVGR